MTDEEDRDVNGLQSVMLTMQILEQIIRTPKGVGVTSLARSLNSGKSRIHRHLQTLVQQGYVVQDEDSERYEIGHGLISMGQAIFDNAGLARAAHDPLMELRDTLGHSAVASQLTADGMLVIATAPGRSPVEIGVRIGSLLSLHGSAQGKVATAYSSPGFQARVLRSRLELATPFTVVTPSLLANEFVEIRKNGWAVAPNQTAVGLNTLASPIFDASGRICGAAGIVDMIQFIDERPSQDQIEHTVRAARKISKNLGYSVEENNQGEK